MSRYSHLHVPALARRRGQRRFLLLTGTPGTGKRPLASYLAATRGFVHVDLDNRETRTRYLRAGESAFRNEVAALASTNRKVVVTWRFSSETQLAYVESLRKLGFEWIWMDSDRGASFDAMVVRHPTMSTPRFLDPFENDGRFRPFEAVTGELRRRRVPLPRRVPRVRVPVPAFVQQRPAWAGVLAFAAAATAAAGAYVAGAFSPAQPARVIALAHQPAHLGHAALPTVGVLIRGESLGGVALGDTKEQVRALWGSSYSVCGTCDPKTWFYFDANKAAGVAVGFRDGFVTAVYTLGTPVGWRTSDGVRIGTLVGEFNNPAGKTTACVGYGAVSTRSANTVTSILMNGQSVYGFALTRPNEPVCH
jgi:hypothetical protein